MAVSLGPSAPVAAKAAPNAAQEVIFILDKSGSMSTCREKTISGFNEFLGDLKRQTDHPVHFTLTLFDTEVTQRHRGENAREVPDLVIPTYVPSGNTALYDALGQTLAAAERRLAGDRESVIVVVVMTDGEENSSREFTSGQIKAQIERLRALPNWTFVFLGADQDAWAQSARLGFTAGNTLSYPSTRNDVVITQASDTVRSLYRSGTKKTEDFFQQTGKAPK